jgi:Family of unknown function (DUF5995)
MTDRQAWHPVDVDVGDDRPWGPIDEQMAEALAADPTNIAEVVTTLMRVQRALDDLPPLYHDNPVADFNALYTTITAKILAEHRTGGFADPAFLTVLDVEFGRRYFDALRMWGARSVHTPQTWVVLLDRSRDARLRSLPCAVAGVNAHINYDLPFALIATWRTLGHSVAGSPQHGDYLRVNEVFREAIPGLRRGYLARWQLYVDRLNGTFDDWYQNALIELSRSRAWEHAQDLWPLRDDPERLETQRAELDAQAARIGRALLSPFSRLLQ